MARIKKYGITYNQPLSSYGTFILDTDPNSKYFKITEFKDTFTGGKNGFLIEGSEHLMQNTEIKIQVLDVEGNPLYVEYGNGIPEYYEGTSKIAAVYVYEDTPIGPATITILGELKTYLDDGGVVLDIPEEWRGNYNLKWNKTFKINKLLSNEDKVRFYKRPKVEITEIIKPVFATTFANVSKKGFVNGTPIVPTDGTKIADYTLPTSYKLTTTDGTAWTGSMVGSVIELTDLGYTATISDVLNKNEILVRQPYTENGLVTSFTSQRYTSSFNYIEGVSNIASALTGSFAKINLTDLETFVGDVARVKIFRKSQSQIGDYQFVQEVKLETSELLVDLESQTTNQDYYGIFTQDVINNYWVTSSNNLTAEFNQNYLYDSTKLSSTTANYFFTTKSLAIIEGNEYTLNFNTRLDSNTSPNNYLRVFLSGSRTSTIGGVTSTTGVEQTITTIKSDNALLQKTTSIDNIKAEQIDNAKLYFEVKGNGWYISNVSFTLAQETAFSPDAISFIQSVPRNLPVETFDYRFEFYDINNNYIPVLVEKTKTFNGGNIQNLQKSLVFSPRTLIFQFDSGSNPVAPTVVGFTVTKNLLTGSITYTSQSYDFDGNELKYDDYTASGHFPGLLSNLLSDTPTMTVGNFTGSREDKLVQIVKITGRTEGYEDSVIFTKVLDGFGGVNHLIRPYRGTDIRNSSTQSLEVQAVRIDGVNDIELSSTTQPGKGWPTVQLHVLSASADKEYFINIEKAVAQNFIKGVSVGELGSKELNYNAVFNRDSIDKRRTIYLIKSGSITAQPAYIASASILSSIVLSDLQDGLDSGFVSYDTDVFNINFRNDINFSPVTASVTASFYVRGTNMEPLTASLTVFPSMSINKDFVPEYWVYYVTHSSTWNKDITIVASDDNNYRINSGGPNSFYGSYVRSPLSQSKTLTTTFKYTEPYTLTEVTVDKTFTIVPAGKPGDESIVFEIAPQNVSLKANAKGEVNSYQPSITDIRLKQGSRYLSFTGSISQSGTFYIAQSSITSSNITGGLVYFDKNYTSSLIVSASSGLVNLSGSIIYPLIIHPYYTSSIYTQSIVQNYTKVMDGPPPLQVILSPVAVTLNADEVGYVGNYSAANTTIQVKDGDDFLKFTTTESFANAEAAKGTFRISNGASVVPTHIQVASIETGSNTNTGLIKFNRFDYPFVSASAIYNIVAFPYSLGPGHQYTSSILQRTQTFNKNVSPSNSRNVNLSATSTTVNFDGDGIITSPLDPVVLTATATNTTGAVWYQFFKDDTEYTSIQSDNFVEIGGGDAVSPGETSTWAVKIRDGNSSPSALVRAQASVSIAGIKEGATAYNTSLTNENSSVVYKVSGQITLTGTNTTIKATKGDKPLLHKSTFSPKTTDQFGNDIGSIGEYKVKIHSKSSHITLAGGLVSASTVPTVANEAVFGGLTAWDYPITNPTATIVYQVDLENGRAVFYKTQSFSVQYEGNTGPGVVMRGTWSSGTNYIGSVETTNYRRDAVIYGTNPTTYYAALSGSGPGTSVGAQTPSGTTSDTAYWQYLGTQDFFVSAKLAIFDESYVKNTLNVGTYADTSQFANVIIAGGRTDPYIAIGQHGTYGTSGGGFSPTNPAVIGYGQSGIFLGIYENGASGTSGRFSIVNAGTSTTSGLFWDGSTLTIKGAVRQTPAGTSEGRVLGAWVSGYSYLQNDIVSNAGRTWYCTNAHTSGASTEPFVGASYASYWALAADAGTSGTAGSGGTAGGPGPGVVFRGPYDATKSYYKSSTRTDAVSYTADGSNYWLTNNSSLNGQSGTNWGTPAAANANWISFGAEFSSIATGTIISEQSYVRATLNVGTNTAGDAANIAIVGGTTNPYISIGQTTQGYANAGIFLGNSAGYYRMSLQNSDESRYLRWNGSTLDLKGDVTAINGYIGAWKITGNILQSTNANITLDAAGESITVFDSGGALRFQASTETTLPTVAGAAPTSVYMSAGTLLDKGTYNGGGDKQTSYQDSYFDATSTFTPSAGGKHIIKYTYNPATTSNSSCIAYGGAYAVQSITIQVRTGANGTGTLVAESNSIYNYAYGSITNSGGYGGYISVTGDTLITLADGSKIMAKNITKGAQILSWDWRDDKNQFISTSLTNVRSRKVNKFYKVGAGEFEVKVSETHGFWLDNNTQIKVTDIEPGSTQIYIKSNNQLQKVLVDYVDEIIAENTDVYTLEVEGTNNYISDGILSHNFYGGSYIFDGQTNYIAKPQTLSVQPTLSAIAYYITMHIQWILTSDDTNQSPWNESSYAYLKFTEPGTTVSIEPVSAGTIANGGGFQSAVSGKRYMRLSTQSSDYDSKGAAYNLTAGLEAKGALWLSGNINDNTDIVTKGYGKVFTDNSYWYGYPAAVKAFGSIRYTGADGNSGQANDKNYYTFDGSYNIKVSSTPLAINTTYRSYQIFFDNDLGTSNYEVLLQSTNIDYTSTARANIPMLLVKTSTYFIFRIQTLSNATTWVGEAKNGGYLDFMVVAL